LGLVRTMCRLLLPEASPGLRPYDRAKVRTSASRPVTQDTQPLAGADHKYQTRLSSPPKYWWANGTRIAVCPGISQSVGVCHQVLWVPEAVSTLPTSHRSVPIAALNTLCCRSTTLHSRSAAQMLTPTSRPPCRSTTSDASVLPSRRPQSIIIPLDRPHLAVAASS
jgi:hypothetical protein